jgi:hypothetical protein
MAISFSFLVATSKRHQVLSSTDDAALWCIGGIGVKRRRCSHCQPALDAGGAAKVGPPLDGAGGG